MEPRTIARWGVASVALLLAIILMVIANPRSLQHTAAATNASLSPKGNGTLENIHMPYMSKAEAMALFGNGGVYNATAYSTGNMMGYSSIIGSGKTFNMNITSMVLVRYAGKNGEVVEEVFNTSHPQLLYNELRYYVSSYGNNSTNRTEKGTGLRYLTGLIGNSGIHAVVYTEGNIVSFASVIWIGNTTHGINGTLMSIAKDGR